jgi:hypothetical protein
VRRTTSTSSTSRAPARRAAGRARWRDGGHARAGPRRARRRPAGRRPLPVVRARQCYPRRLLVVGHAQGGLGLLPRIERATGGRRRRSFRGTRPAPAPERCRDRTCAWR